MPETPLPFEEFYRQISEQVTQIPSERRIVYIQDELIPMMLKHRGHEIKKSPQEITSKLFSIDKQKPGELMEFIEEVIKSGRTLTSDLALEIADVMYYFDMLFESLVLDSNTINKQLQQNVEKFMNISFEEARLFTIVKYLTRIHYKSLPKEERKQMESQMISRFIPRRIK